LCALGAFGAFVWSARGSSQRLVVATRAIHRGDLVQASMLRWARVSGSHLVGVGDPAEVIGKLAQTDIAPGEPVEVDAVGSPPTVGADQVEVGVALSPGDYPIDLAAGDTVQVLAVPSPDATGHVADPVSLTSSAQVTAAPGSDPASGAKVVADLVIDRAEASLVVGASAIRLVRVNTVAPPGSTASSEVPMPARLGTGIAPS
jgi:hypothetical protein